MSKKHASSQAAVESEWIPIEKILCLCFVLAKCLLLWKMWNQAVGFDWKPHIDMISTIRFTTFNTDIFATFYSYHPPFAFFIARLFFLMGTPIIGSVQLTSALAIFISFFFLRATLRLLKLLTKPEGIAFLYIVYALPLNIFLSYSVNMDSVIFACTSGVLYYSIQMLMLKKNASFAHQLLTIVLTAVFVAAGLLTKFTGILLLPIPLFVFFFLSKRIPYSQLWLPICSIVIALIFVFPYYSLRYYKTQGVWLPSNTNHFDAISQKQARAQRDSDRIVFVTNLFGPTTVHKKGIQFRDLTTARLADTWKDVWIMDQWLIDGSKIIVPLRARIIGTVYLTLMPFLLLGGFAMHLWQLRKKNKNDVWQRFGLLLLSYSALLILALIFYIYKNPWAGSLANKAIYIAPATLGIGYLLAEYTRTKKSTHMSQILLFGLLVCMMIMSHLIPVY
ncbi:MAG: glycosyltransferase family 39 protein [Candidatus Peribacteraceae bacterium]|nr:glycosyltransferase family 39 protein [Candidatus Peribacteraceae bacterium]